jgi:hypothetical protein
MNTYFLLCTILLFAGTAAAPTIINNMAYCGFGERFCGDSFNDDVYSRINNVVLAYALIASNGAIYIDTDNYPKSSTTTTIS